MTLVEIITAMGVMSIMMASVLAAFIQTRRLAAASVAQNCATTIVQGYIEQIKGLTLKDFINSTDSTNVIPNLTVSYPLPTMKDPTSGDAWIQLATTPSTVAATTLTGATPGISPTGAVDNLQSFDMDSRSTAGTNTWATAWPGHINNYPGTAPTTTPASNPNVPGTTDLRMNFWVQISDLTPTITPKCKAYQILLVYTWQYVDGGRVKYRMDTVRTIRSAVQTF